MTIVGFAASVRKEASRGSGIRLIPPSLTLILSKDIRALIERRFRVAPYFSVIFA